MSVIGPDDRAGETEEVSVARLSAGPWFRSGWKLTSTQSPGQGTPPPGPYLSGKHSS